VRIKKSASSLKSAKWDRRCEGTKGLGKLYSRCRPVWMAETPRSGNYLDPARQ